MRLLSESKYDNVRHLFHRNYPNLPEIFAIIEHIIPGKIWVDDEDRPTLCLITSGAPYCFMKGVVNEEIFQHCFQLLKEKQMIKLALEPLPPFDLSRFGFTAVARRQYRYKTNSNIPIFENTSRYPIKKIETEEILNQCHWKSLKLQLFGEAENYLKNGIGFIMWDEQNKVIASEAHGVASQEYIEIGTVTHEKYRGQALSTILCNHLIRYAVQQNLKPVWSCDETNVASWKVAEKQGMDELIPYTFYTWRQ